MKKSRKQIRSDRLWKHWLYWLKPPYFGPDWKELPNYDPEEYREAFHAFQTHGSGAVPHEKHAGLAPLVAAQRAKEVFLTTLALESFEWWAKGWGWEHPWQHTLEMGKTDQKKMDRLTKVAILRTIKSIRPDPLDFFDRHPGITAEEKVRFFGVREATLGAANSVPDTPNHQE